MIKVLIVDDSLVQQELLTYILNSDPEIKVIGSAFNGEDALIQIGKLKPDLVTMDINMPKMGGIECIRQIMMKHPLPIVVISGSKTKTEQSDSMQAIAAGAVWVAERTTISQESMKSLINTVKLMSEVKVVKRHGNLPSSNAKAKPKLSYQTKANLIVIGASTGGPVALQAILANLQKQFPPILIVQHISAGFLEGLSDWLTQSTGRTISIATHYENLEPNHVYLAPSGVQVGVNSSYQVILNSEDNSSTHRPSVNYLFHSAAQSFGKQVLGVLLTGMGKDGAEGLNELKQLGAMTIIQDEESAIVYGMPGAALALDAASAVLTPLEIASFINLLDIKKS